MRIATKTNAKSVVSVRFDVDGYPGNVYDFHIILRILRNPLRDPFGFGRSDLDPLCGGRAGGGGMVFDPFRSQDPRNIGGIYGPGGPAGLPPYVQQFLHFISTMLSLITCYSLDRNCPLCKF